MKKCAKCQQLKQNAEFYRESRRKDGLGLYCKPCWNLITVENQKRRKAEFVKYKGGKCQNCGYDKCLAALEFHHTDPSQKEFNISKNMSTKRMLPELDKCILLCSNCHKEAHYSDN